MRISKTNNGILGFLEKHIRKHPLLYIFFRSIIRFTNIFEKDFDGLKLINFRHNINVIDVGASDGIAVNFFIKNLNVKKVICFEPYKKFINILKQNKKIIIKPYAIGNSNKKIKIFFPRYFFFYNYFDFINYVHYDLDLLKHFIKDFKFRKNLKIVSTMIKIRKIKNINYKIDLIKIDTNGYELEIIKGLINIIKKNKPILIIEINKDHKIISNLLKKYNYDSFYYSINKKKFLKKPDKNSTNKYFFQKNLITRNYIN